MKFSKYIGLATLCMCLNGCTDFIDNAPDDIITIDMIFDDKTRTEDWLAGVYQGIRDPYWDYTRYDAFEMLANDITPSQGWLPYWGSDCGLGFRVGQWEPNSGWSGSYWTMSKYIRQAYIFMDNVMA